MAKGTCPSFSLPSLCRCCGLRKNSGTNIQGPCSGNDRPREDKLFRDLSYLPRKVINIRPSDKLSKFICVDCEMTLHHFSKFCEMVIKVQADLKIQLKTSIIENLNTEKPQPKTDCHVNGKSLNGSAVVIRVNSAGQIKCLECQSSVTLSQLMTLHMLTHGLGTVLCACQLCGHRDHVDSFLNIDKGSIKCPQCRFLEFREPGPTRVNQKKTSEEAFVCEVCEQSFQTKYRYNRHKLIHIGAKPFLCETCGMKFNQKTTLKLHMMKHSKTNPYTCQWCGQSFRFKVSLQSHILNIHRSSSEKMSKYECDQCRKQFATVYKLRRHYRLHTGDRPYECSVCHKGFSQTGNLKNHMKKHKSDLLSGTFETDPIHTDALLESDQILDTILDSCPQGKEFMGLGQQEPNYGLVTDNVGKHNAVDLFSDFNPQDVLFDNTPIIPSPNTSCILPNFSSIQGGTSDINSL